MTQWITDAQFAKDIDEQSLLVSNQRISKFLHPTNHDQFIIVASKGMGKTLLLRRKRKLIEQQDPSLLIIPRNETSDYVSLPASLPKEIIALMDDRIFWEDVWKLSIAVSALLNFPHRISDDEKRVIRTELDRADLPSSIVDDIREAFDQQHVIQRAPSSVLDIILQSNRKAIEKMRSSGLQIILQLFNKYISSGCVVFIDSFDQALNRLFSNNLIAWCAAQCGLLKAAWEMSRHNRHVKVYVTIRQEAYSSFDDSEKMNIRGNLLLLEYTKDDFEAIFERAIQYYENVSTIETFIGFPMVYNGYLRIQERVFDYIYRHTIGIPRWLMTMGSEISNLREKKNLIKNEAERKLQQKRVADTVNRVSSEELALDYIKNEMKLFFGRQQPDEFIDQLLTRINSMVLSFANVSRIAAKVTGSPAWTGTEHPFCLLFNLGLLGYVARSASNTTQHQTFKKPYQFDWNYEQILPTDPNTYYMIHPCLHHLVQSKNPRFNYSRVKIGDATIWTSKDRERIESEKLKIFISYAHEDAKTVEEFAEHADEYLSVKAVIHDIWFDQWKMKSGKWFQDQMKQGLQDSDYLILVVSKNSLGSNAVALEWKTKFAEKIQRNVDSVFPFIIDDTAFGSLDEFLSNIFCYRYAGDKSKVERLLDDIMYWRDE